jgi:glycosyltransferase involved in cell wall biosynthesis
MAAPSNRRSLIAVVPAFDEAARIGAVLDVLLAYPGFAEVIVSDDGSTDGTARLAAAKGARVVRHERRGGKGAAMRRAVETTTAEVLFFCDADIAGLTHAMIDEVVAPVLAGTSEMFVAQIDRRIYKAPLVLRNVPLLGGIRAVTRELWESVPESFKAGFGIESALNHYAAQGGHRVQFKVFRGLTQTVKEKKYGLLRGTLARWRMAREVVATRWALRSPGHGAERSVAGPEGLDSGRR